jgi:hypothetical protein
VPIGRLRECDELGASTVGEIDMYFVAWKLPTNRETPSQNYCLSSTVRFKKLLQFTVLVRDLGFAIENRAAGAKICDVPQRLTAGLRDTPRDLQLLPRSGYSICCMLCMDGFLVIRAEFVKTPQFVRSHQKGEFPSSG